MDFKNLKSLTIPEGEVSSISVGGTVIWSKPNAITIEQVGSYGFNKGTISGLSLSSDYDGPYISSNKHIGNSYSVAKIIFKDRPTFKIWINSYAESRYDYTIASTLDASTWPIEYGSSTTKTHTRGKQLNPSSFPSNWTEVTYENDGNEHFIYVVYRKDSGGDSYNDEGCFIIQK